MTRSTCWNNEETLKNCKSCYTAWNHLWIPALRELDFEPSVKRDTNRARALVSLLIVTYLYLKQVLAQISTYQPRQTLSDCLRLEKSLTKSPNPILFSISKQISPKLPSQLMPMTGVISEVVTPKGKTKSNSLGK